MNTSLCIYVYWGVPHESTTLCIVNSYVVSNVGFVGHDQPADPLLVMLL